MSGRLGGRLTSAFVVLTLVAVGTLLGSALTQLGDRGPVDEEAPPGPGGRRVRVEVLNGAGVDGAARSATNRLRHRGFDVVFFGNAPAFGVDSSVVTARTGDTVAARAVADALRIRNVRSDPDANLYLDVSVVLGADWSPETLTEPTDRASRLPWWNPRRWWPR